MFSQPGLTGEDHTRSSDLLAGLGRHFLVETGERGTGDEKGGGAGKEQGGYGREKMGLAPRRVG